MAKPKKADQLYFRAGDRPTESLLVHDGLVRLYVTDPLTGGRLTAIEFVQPGKVFGEEAALGVEAAWSACAMQPNTWVTPVKLTVEAAGKLLHERLVRLTRRIACNNASVPSFTLLASVLRELPWPDMPGSYIAQMMGRTDDALRRIVWDLRGRRLIEHSPDGEWIVPDQQRLFAYLSAKALGRLHIDTQKRYSLWT